MDPAAKPLKNHCTMILCTAYPI